MTYFVRQITGRSVRACAIVSALLLSACALPPLNDRVASTAIRSDEPSAIARALAPVLAEHSDKSGIYTLAAPRDAFAARGMLARMAERSIDAQYYIWHGDQTGYLLLEALWEAAERGVRVRLLLDDINTKGLDDALAAMDSHASIEVRLYNPLVHRSMRLLNFVTSPRRVNRRMHNKSFTIDNQMTIVGGRNIGDEYFGAGEVAFEDLDVAAVGPIVQQTSADFDRYWNSGSAYPASAMLDPATPDSIEKLRHTFASVRNDPKSAAYLASLRDTKLGAQLESRTLAFEWTQAQLVSDDPAKTLDTDGKSDLLLLPRMLETVGTPTEQLDLVSPYFVPMEQGTNDIAALSAKVRVRILTNSLESTDVGAVHAGYAKRRKSLLRAGVELYELKRGEGAPDPKRTSPAKTSSASLHAKTFVVDRKRVFVGSFNFDPRSARLNTELGFVFESELIGNALTRMFDVEIPQRAYEVRLSDSGKSVFWIERTPTGEQRYDGEPHTSVWRRFGVSFMSILPIESLL